MRKIYLIESIPAIADKFVQALSSAYDIKVCTNANCALSVLNRFRPDLLVVDLTMPDLDALSLVDHAYFSGIRPKVVVSTTCWHVGVEDWLAHRNAGSMLLRPFTADFLIKAATDLLLDMEDRSQVDIYRVANELLLLLGFSLASHGYRYVLEAVVYVCKKMDCMLSCELYPDVAKKFGVSAFVVERAIRRCIENAWEKRDDRAWNLYFPKDHNGRTRHLSNGAFLKRISFAVNEYQNYHIDRYMAK